MFLSKLIILLVTLTGLAASAALTIYVERRTVLRSSDITIVDTQGRRIGTLLDPHQSVPAEQVAYYKRISPYFGKLGASRPCPANRVSRSTSWWNRFSGEILSLVNTMVHAQSCVPSFYIEAYCPDCAAFVCASYGPGCAQILSDVCPNCYTVESCSP